MSESSERRSLPNEDQVRRFMERIKADGISVEQIVAAMQGTNTTAASPDAHPNATPALTLVDFLRARLDEDVKCYEDQEYWSGPLSEDELVAHVEAKRRIIDTYEAALSAKLRMDAAADAVRGDESVSSDQYMELAIHRATTGGAAIALEGCLKSLALPYAAHPDYRQEWRP